MNLFLVSICLLVHNFSTAQACFDKDNALILKKGVPKEVREFTYQSLIFQAPQLLNTRFIPILFDLPPISPCNPNHYIAMNNSVIKTDAGYLVLCRTVNYVLTDKGDYICFDFKFRQRNFLLKYDREFHLLSQHEVIENLPREHFYWVNVEGIEDCRLFHFQNRVWFIGITLDTNPAHQRQMSLGRLAEEASNGIIAVDKLIPLQGPDPKRCEKNWMPIVNNDELQLIYSYDPFVVFQPDLITGACHKIEKKQPQHDFSSFRGSAAPIPFDDGYLMLVHETLYFPHAKEPGRGYYLKRFVLLDKDYNIIKLSKPFTFKHMGVEFCAGITLDHAKKNLVMGISLQDKESHFCIVDLETVRNMLEPL